MAKFFLLNTVRIGTSVIDSGRLLDGQDAFTSTIESAGGQLWPATDERVAAAAARVQGLWAQGQKGSANDAIMSAAAAANGVPYEPRRGRVDLSINKARVDNPNSSTPFLMTQTGTSLPTAYAGGGTGNKAVLGFLNDSALLVRDLKVIEYEWSNLSPGNYAGPLGEPYLNINLDLDGDGVTKKLVAISKGGGGDNDFAVADLGGGRFRYTHDTSKHWVQVVGDLTDVTPIFPGTFPGNAYSWADILAVHPNATLRAMDPADGGLPLNVVCPWVMVCIGDSNNVNYMLRSIDSMKVNGSQV